MPDLDIDAIALRDHVRRSEQDADVDALVAEVRRLRTLVGDESTTPGGWTGCDRNEAIRQAVEFHAGQLRWMKEHDKRRDERDKANAAKEDAYRQALLWREKLDALVERVEALCDGRYSAVGVDVLRDVLRGNGGAE